MRRIAGNFLIGFIMFTGMFLCTVVMVEAIRAVYSVLD